MTSRAPICDIILLSWNSLDYLRDCVESLFKYTHLPVRLIIIDNASDTDTQSYLGKLKAPTDRHITLEVIFNTENKGFVKGMNQGMKLSTAPYVCLLNNDTRMMPKWLELSLEAFRKDPKVGIVNPNSTTFGTWPKKGESDEGIARRLLEEHSEMPVTEVGTAIGFCMFIKREVIERIGYLEESLYKFYFEDTDYCKRAIRAGYFCVVANQAYVFHYEHGSLPKKGDRDFYFKKNQEWFHQKWGKPLRIFWPKKTFPTTEEKKIITQIARDDHMIYLCLPKSEEHCWKDRHSNIHLTFHRFNRLSYFYLLFRVLKRRKKPFDFVLSKDFSKLSILRGLKGISKTETRKDVFDIPELKDLCEV